VTIPHAARAVAGFALLGWLAWGFVVPPAALAHATYVRSDPPSGGQLATPGRLRVVFTEDVDPGFSELQVLDSARRRVDLRDTQPVPNDPKSLNVSVPQLPDGVYTVAWKTLSAVDGHTVQGAFPLVVGTGEAAGGAQVSEAPPSPIEVAVRALSFLGALLLVGGFAFTALVVRPALRALARGSHADLEKIEPAWEARAARLGLVLVGALALVHVTWLLVQVADAVGGPLSAVFGEPLLRYLQTRNGQFWIAKLALLALLGIALAGLRGGRLLLVGLALGAAYLLITSLTSHAAAFARGAELAVALDWLHQVGAALWLGSLAAAIWLLALLREVAPERRSAALAVIVPRLSTLALLSVVVLVASGAFAALAQVGRPEAFATLYGGALAFKIAALVPMLLLGALNLLVFKPRFVAAARSAAQSAADRTLGLGRRFRLVLVGEVALGVAIVLATGVLTAAEPAREVWARQPRPLDLRGAADDLQVRVRVEPGRVGENRYTVDVLGPNGQPAPDVQRVQLRFDYLDANLGRGTRLAPPEGESFAVTGSDFSTAGRWQLEVAVRRLNREDSVAAFQVEIGVPAGEYGGSAIPLPLFTGSFVPLALALLVGSLLAVAWIWSTAPLRAAQRRGYTLACAIVGLAGALIVVRSASFGPDLRSLRNPIPPSSASVSQGRQLYLSSGCVDCHGESGRGDGPLGRALRPRPADFRIHMQAGHTDGELFDWISNGVPGTAMPAFAGQLSETDRWNLINFIRGFAGDQSAEQPPATGQSG
jgi:copper transport protein